MPSLKDALKPPANLDDMIQVATVAAPPAPPALAPREQPGLAPGSLGPAPSSFTTDYDRVRQWFRPGTSQNRMPPLPLKANPQLGAVAISNAKVTTATDTDIVITDGLTHGDPIWWLDPGFVFLRDDFLTIPGANNTSLTSIGDHGWWQLLNGGSVTTSGRNGLQGGAPPYIGQYAWENVSGSLIGAVLVFNGTNFSSNYAQNGLALLENPGWKSTFIFKVSSGGNGNPEAAISTKSKSMYVGLAGNISVDTYANSLGTRPNIFIGVRYDTSVTPAAMRVSSVAAASGGNTTYTMTFPNGNTAGIAGQTITFSGAANGANNGTFTIQSATTTTVVVNNASGVAETASTYQLLGTLPSIILTAVANASGSSTAYTYINTSNYVANQLVGMTFTVTGFTNGANNGTWQCIANTAAASGTITLANASGVAETKQAFMSTTDTCNDSFFTLEVVNAVQNDQAALAATSAISTTGRSNRQGTKFVTNISPTAGSWHRLDITCTAAGVVSLTLDGTNTLSNAAMPMTTMKSILGLNINGQGNGGNVFFSWSTLQAPVATGTKITVAGFTGGGTSLNGTYELFAASSTQANAKSTANTSLIQQTTPTITMFPALLPIFGFGNDDTAGGAFGAGMRFYADYWSLIWNPNLGGSAPGSPSNSNPRYFLDSFGF